MGVSELKKNRVQLDDLKPNAAAELTEADIAHVTGGALSRRFTGGLVPVETISLNYSKIEFEYKPQKDDGGL